MNAPLPRRADRNQPWPTGRGRPATLAGCSRCTELAGTTTRLSELALIVLGLPHADAVARAARRAGQRYVDHRLSHLGAP